MERITDADGEVAQRLNEIEPTADEAREWHQFLIGQIVRMLCAGLIHGDLSEFNVLLGAAGPVIIQLPQAIDAFGNNNAFRSEEHTHELQSLMRISYAVFCVKKKKSTST